VRPRQFHNLRHNARVRQFRTAYAVGLFASVAIGVCLLKRAPWILSSRLITAGLVLLLFAPVVIGQYLARVSGHKKDRRD
jgi:hypothetical protein